MWLALWLFQKGAVKSNLHALSIFCISQMEIWNLSEHYIMQCTIVLSAKPSLLISTAEFIWISQPTQSPISVVIVYIHWRPWVYHPEPTVDGSKQENWYEVPQPSCTGPHVSRSNFLTVRECFSWQHPHSTGFPLATPGGVVHDVLGPG